MNTRQLYFTRFHPKIFGSMAASFLVGPAAAGGIAMVNTIVNFSGFDLHS